MVGTCMEFHLSLQMTCGQVNKYAKYYCVKCSNAEKRDILPILQYSGAD